MSDELEILEAASVSALASDKTGDGYLNGPCPNCSTEIIGNFCFNCGQSARDLKRLFFSLIRDMLGDLFSFDGRVWKTIPSLMFRPGKVTRSYIDGQRMRFVPPFRLFLIASVLFFLVLFGITQKQSWAQGKDLNFNFGSEFIGTVIIDNKPIAEYEGFDQLFKDNEFNRVAAESFIDKLITENVIDETELNRDALLDKIEAMSGESLNRKELLLVIQKWVPRLSFLLLPSYVLPCSSCMPGSGGYIYMITSSSRYTCKVSSTYLQQQACYFQWCIRVLSGAFLVCRPMFTLSC